MGLEGGRGAGAAGVEGTGRLAASSRSNSSSTSGDILGGALPAQAALKPRAELCTRTAGRARVGREAEPALKENHNRKPFKQ